MKNVPVTRRELLVCVAAGAVNAASKYSPVVAAQLYVWTQQFRKERRTLAEGVAGALAATRRAGYEHVELMASFFDPGVREHTLPALKANALDAPIVYDGGPMHEPEAAEKTAAKTLELAAAAAPAGARIVNFNPSPKRDRKTLEELKTQARYLRRLEADLRARGVRLILHHHNPEMAEGAREWRFLLAETDVPLCLDLHWAHRGGQDPMGLLREAGKRVASVHLRNSRQGVWTEDLGGGDIDYRPVADYLRNNGFAGYLVVELAYENGTAITRSLEENLRLSREWLAKVFGSL
jgi:inosose dehydratase